MHNLKGRQSAQLDTYSGLVTLAGAQDLAEGASPRLQNVDFNMGSVFTRQGLLNPFVYSNAAVGPSPGSLAVDVSIPFGSTWSNPSYITADNGRYASVTLNNITLTVADVQVLSYTPPYPQPVVYGLLVTFSTNVPPVQSGQTYSFSGLTNYSVLNGQTLSPTTLFPYTPAANQQIFLFGTAAYGPAADTGSAQLSTVYSSDFIQDTEFSFSVPSTATPQGFQVTILGYGTNGGTVSVQMMKAGVPIGNVESVALNIGSPTIVTLGGINDLFDASWIYSDLNNTSFGVQIGVTSAVPTTIYLSVVKTKAYFAPTQVNFNYVTTFEDSFGNIRTLALDASGQWWVENVSTAIGTLSPLFSGPPAGSFASSFTANSRQYIAISDLLQGDYPPQQYTGEWIDRVSQVGPGAPPIFTGIGSTSTTFAISTITQPTAQSRGYSYFLQSTGPGSSSPGNVVTVYYSDSTLAGPDTDLVNAFNSGQPVYIFTSFTGGPTTQGPYTQIVTSVGLASPPGQPRQFYYYTYNVTSNAYTYYQGSGHPSYTANYQRSLATMTMSVPVPGLIVGGTATITGSSITAYDAAWTITQTPNSGAYSITATQVSGGVAIYNYTLISGTAPSAGQLVTITGTDNANGALNLTNATIATSSGGSSGTFTVSVSSPDFASATEQGQATTAGTIFTFDPGALTLGSSTNPIYGNATGGQITFSGTNQLIGSGARQAVVFFITRNGYWTRPSPPITFSLSTGIQAIQATQIPIGPPNVVARAIAFTEGGQNGVPGANFYTIPQPVNYVVQNVTYTATSLFINDNTTTTATFQFTDAVLLNAQAIDIAGNDLFNLGEIGDAAWCTQYAGRTVWGRVRNKIQNFLNLSFDGGYVANPGANVFPLGWQLNSATVPSGSGPTLLISPVFGNSFYLHNTSGSTQDQFSMIYQSAYQDWNKVAILQNQTAYSVRVTARTPSGATSGALVVDLTRYNSGTGFSTTLGTYTLNLSAISSTMATYQGTLLTNDSTTIPSDLVLRLWGQNIPNGADIEIDCLEIFPTIAPTNLTGLTFSYQSDPESFDLVTGGQDTATVNAQPANGAFTMHDQLYIVKESSLGYLSDSPNQEPANWNPFKEVSNVAGASGINAYDVGEEWAVMGCQNGLYLFNGGVPIPIQLEIPDVWAAINWNYGHTICIRNDVANRKIYCAIPLPTPNPWMLDTVSNPNPTTPNVVLMLNYEGIETIERLMESMSMHVTMSGKLAVQDLRRKWALWTIPTPYMGMVKRNELFSQLMFCNGSATSKIYYLGGTRGVDDGSNFTSSYCTYGFVDRIKAAENPMFGLHNKRYDYFDLLANGSGTATVRFLQNNLTPPYPYTVPGGAALTNPMANDIEGPLNEFAQRLFMEIEMDNGWFELSRSTLVGAADRWSPIRGF